MSKDDLIESLLLRALLAEAALEHEQQMAMAFVFDASRPQNVKCYWCEDVIGDGRDDAAIRAHVAECRKRVTP